MRISEQEMLFFFFLFFFFFFFFFSRTVDISCAVGLGMDDFRTSGPGLCR